MEAPHQSTKRSGASKREQAETIAENYAAKLLPVGVAAKLFGLSLPTFWKLRRRHGIVLLVGRRVHVGDIIDALEKDRKDRQLRK
jgi:hypothetical protein